jgi:hypothetical protein
VCRVRLARGADVVPELRLDTLVIDVDRECVLLLWRGCVPLRDGPHDVLAVELREAAESTSLDARRAA